MVNLDSEELGVVTCGCAGGLRSDLILRYTPEDFSGEALRISVGGLMGGHSGANIHCGRANANKLLGRLLTMLMRECDLRVVSIEGGSKDNAIPRECVAVIAVSDAEAASLCLTRAVAAITAELVSEDAGFTVAIEDIDAPVTMLSKLDTARVCALLAGASNGVLAMRRDVADLVEYSRNLGVVRTEDDTMTFVFSSRSSMEGRLDASVAEMDALAVALGFETKHHGRYPGWAFASKSPLREAYLSAYRAVTGEDAVVNTIHAGLECGIIYSHIPDMDMISVGPTLFDIHSPAEAMDLTATEVFCKTLMRLIESL
jgi:dipeptidase D